MARARKPLLVPVRRDGGIMHDTDYCRGAGSWEEFDRINAEQMEKNGHTRWGAEYVMQEVEPFEASLRVKTSYHVRSSVHVVLVDREGREYPMFLGDLVPLLGSANVVDGWIEPMTYETCKRSTRWYGIRPVKVA